MELLAVLIDSHLHLDLTLWQFPYAKYNKVDGICNILLPMLLKLLKIQKETKDALSLIFEKPVGFNFYPGQYLDVELPVSDSRTETRIFSISSSPSEDFVMLTYKLGLSPYKKKLQTLKAGDTVSSSHPAGTVVIDDSTPAVLLPGGVGITPHRSMIKWAVDRNLNLPITLIYSNSDSEFIFKNELEKWRKTYKNLHIIYVVTTLEGRVDEEKIRFYSSLLFKLRNPIYYLAGPPRMVDTFEEILLKLGVDSTNIRTDRFDGY